ncbi:MAG: TetR/AcrR family transcriptional regulator [Clostridia bacterium]|nr:TetR/AcrR family transcriptional regulator [Clostridia bacterium]
MSHSRILSSARAEFLEKGYMNASIRTIARRAGITSAGLYRHFRDKEEMFAEVVAPAVNAFRDWMDRHVSRGYAGALSGHYDLMWKDTEIDIIREVVYPNLDGFRLLLTCAQGTRYEHFMEEIILEHQHIMMDVFGQLRAQGLKVREISEEELHILMHAYTAALFEPVVQNYPEEKAMHYLRTVENFFLPGWHDLMGC